MDILILIMIYTFIGYIYNNSAIPSFFQINQKYITLDRTQMENLGLDKIASKIFSYPLR